jgi:ribosomal protein S18 acetylase RimI-like enzyme
MISKSDYIIGIEEKPDDDIWEVVSAGLFKFNQENAGLKRTSPIVVVLYDKDGVVKGGVFGNSDWDVFNIDVVWVSEELPGQDFGSEMLSLGEKAALLRGCKIAVVSTFSFQARGLYEKQGYKVFGELNGYPADTRRTGFPKSYNRICETVCCCVKLLHRWW